MPQVIDRFSGKYAWLSNFYVERGGKSVEHWFQAAKAVNQDEWRYVMDAATPRDAKKRGREIRLRTDWEDVKLRIMYKCLKRKFRHPYLRRKLLATGGAWLIEGNYWGDTYWGVCEGRGKNMLGKLLMKLREELRDGDV